jgi:uncharacterized RDD family membrane protein YckC
LEATVTTPENPNPQDPRASKPGEGGEGGDAEGGVDPQEALRGLENRPRIDEQGYPTAYTAVPPPLYGQPQDPGQAPGRESAPGEAQGQAPAGDQAAQRQFERAGRRSPRWGRDAGSGGQPTGPQGGFDARNEQDPYGGYPGYGHPPPPPGYNAPYGEPYGGGPVPGMPPFAGWGRRVAAWLIDNIPALVGLSILDTAYYDWSSGPRAAGWVVTIVGVVWSIYNAFLAGRTGQSTGKRIVGIRLARYLDGQVVGPAFGVLRLFMNAVFWAICVVPGLLNCGRCGTGNRRPGATRSRPRSWSGPGETNPYGTERSGDDSWAGVTRN